MDHRQWAIHPQPREGELLESWLIRLGQANHLSSRWLVGGLLHLEDFLSGQNHVPDQAFKRLVDVSGVSQERILEMHLATFATCKNLAYDVRYVIPARAKSVSSVPIKLCPECVAERDRPYVRLSWGLDLTCLCSTHGCALLDRCPRCRATLRLDLSGSEISFHRCGSCTSVLEVESRWSLQSFSHALSFQDFVLNLERDVQVDLPDIGNVSSVAFVRMVQRIFLTIRDFRLGSILAGFTSASFCACVQPVDDRFSSRYRRLNALGLIAWFFSAPAAHWAELESQLKGTFSLEITPTVTAVRRSFHAAARSLRIPVPSVVLR
jgi:TniQ